MINVIQYVTYTDTWKLGYMINCITWICFSEKQEIKRLIYVYASREKGQIIIKSSVFFQIACLLCSFNSYYPFRNYFVCTEDQTHADSGKELIIRTQIVVTLIHIGLTEALYDSIYLQENRIGHLPPRITKRMTAAEVDKVRKAPMICVWCSPLFTV